SRPPSGDAAGQRKETRDRPGLGRTVMAIAAASPASPTDARPDGAPRADQVSAPPDESACVQVISASPADDAAATEGRSALPPAPFTCVAGPKVTPPSSLVEK